MNNIYRVWFEPESGETCCVLVSAQDEEKALKLAKEEVEGFSNLILSSYEIRLFDINIEHASIC